MVGLAGWVLGLDVEGDVGCLVLGARAAVGLDVVSATPGLLSPLAMGDTMPWRHTQFGSPSSCPLLLPSPSESIGHVRAQLSPLAA